MSAPISWLKAATLLVAFSASVAHADVKAGVALTAQYDSHVLPDPEFAADGATAAWGQKYAMYAGLSGNLSQRWQLAGRYDLSRSVWNDVSGYDSRIQSGYLRLSRRAVWSPEVALLAADAEVDGRGFMQLRRLTPALAYLLSRRWYLRSQLDISHKHFPDYPGRDSRQLHGRLLAFWLLDGTRQYLSAQAGLKREQAEASLYSYQAWLLRVKWKQRFAGLEASLSLKAEHREYDDIRPSLAAERQDMRWRIGGGLAWQLGTGFELSADIGRDLYHSNLAVADYAQNRFEGGLRWDF